MTRRSVPTPPAPAKAGVLTFAQRGVAIQARSKMSQPRPPPCADEL
jgi:hypothetical protein